MINVHGTLQYTRVPVSTLSTSVPTAPHQLPGRQCLSSKLTEPLEELKHSRACQA